MYSYLLLILINAGEQVLYLKFDQYNIIFMKGEKIILHF